MKSVMTVHLKIKEITDFFIFSYFWFDYLAYYFLTRLFVFLFGNCL